LLESERLARALFSRSARGEQADSLASLHPDAVISPSYDPAATVSPAELERHLTGRDVRRVLDAHGHTYIPLDDERIIVEGQVRLRTEDGVEYRPTVWALVFRDRLLYRSWAVGSAQEAGALLAGHDRGGELAAASGQ